jgi:hypothetical protein
MRPAFSSTQQAAAFALLLLALLALPVVIGKNLLPPREQAYITQSWTFNPYPWFRYQFFQEQGDIDIAFVGSSHMANAIDARYVQAKLSEKLGRPAVVRLFGWGGSGYDALYFISRDLLAHRRVRLLVFYDENPIGRNRCNQATFLFRWGEDAGLISNLPLADQGLFYFGSIIGMPRNLLTHFRSNLSGRVVLNAGSWQILDYAPHSTNQLDDLPEVEGFAFHKTMSGEPFVPFTPPLSMVQQEALCYSANTKTNFAISTSPLPAWQIHFARLFADLAHKKNVNIAMLYLPVWPELHETVIPERTFWPAIFGDDLTQIGIPPAKSFNGLTESEILKMYGEQYHLNLNGQQYFTHLITPALLKLYEDSTNH